MLIGIDAGHGLYTAGKRCSKAYDKNETREWTLNSRVANYVQAYLKPYGVSTIRLDDTTGKTDIALETRCKNANNKKCDLVVSIHHNAGGGNGLESYVWNGLPSSSRTIKIGQTIHNALISATGQKNRGLKKADFAIIRDTNMDAVLIEGGFMDNAEDTPRILTDEFAQKYARGIVNGIANYYGLKSDGSTPSVPNNSGSTSSSSNDNVTGDITYQSYDNAKDKWLPEVVNYNDYAGNNGNPMGGVRAKCENGEIKIQSRTLNGTWLDWISSKNYKKNDKDNGNSYSGIYNKPLDAIRIVSTKGYVTYQVKTLESGWLPEVDSRNALKGGVDSYAGNFGETITCIRMK